MILNVLTKPFVLPYPFQMKAIRTTWTEKRSTSQYPALKYKSRSSDISTPHRTPATPDYINSITGRMRTPALLVAAGLLAVQATALTKYANEHTPCSSHPEGIQTCRKDLGAAVG